MKILLVGGGGREHALAWKISQSPLVQSLFVAPGNPGIARSATCVPINVDDGGELVSFAARERVDLVVIGPEVPLVAGLADRFAERGVPVVGPSARAAAIEGSKAFAKDLMARYGIPTARFATFTDVAEARQFCRQLGAPLVVKTDGLAAGKGAIICRTLEEAAGAVGACLEQRIFGAAGAVVVVEEFLHGDEVSYFALFNGLEPLALGAAQDHKAVFDEDRGPNTGGMGAYSPVPVFDSSLEGRVMDTIVRPVFAALGKEGAPYRGVLFIQLMLTTDGPKVVEFNCRWGDPECQVLVTRLESDLIPLLAAAASGDRLPATVAWKQDAAVCVVLASEGYPGTYPTGVPIDGIDAAEATAGVHVFQAGTAERDGKLVTAGGRVLGVTATAPDLRGAQMRAYAAVNQIHFEGMHYRTDIGRRAVR